MKARAEMESANRTAPIVTSGKRVAAGRVIGVEHGGDDPDCHDGRSISEQGLGGWCDQAGSATAVRASFLFRWTLP